MTESVVPANFIQQIEASSTTYAVELVRAVATGLKPTVLHYLPYILAAIFILLIFASVKAMLGKTGTLGSLLYHIFYICGLGIIIWVKGFEILFNPYFDLIVYLLYIICYWLVGLVLKCFRR